MLGQFHFRAGAEIRAVALAGGGAGVIAKGLQSGFGKRLATGVGLEAAGVVVVLVVFPVLQIARSMLMHQGIGGISEGVILHCHRGHPHPFFIPEPIHRRALGAAACFGVVCCRLQFRSIAMMVGDYKRRLGVPVHAPLFIAVMPTLFSREAFEKGQVAFPVLNTVFPLLRRALQIEDRIDNAALFQESAHNGVGALGLENPAVVHQSKTPERRLDNQFIAGTPVAGIASDEFVDHPGKPPKRHAVLPDNEIYWSLQNLCSLNGGVGAGQLKVTLKHLGQALGQFKANH